MNVDLFSQLMHFFVAYHKRLWYISRVDSAPETPGTKEIQMITLSHHAGYRQDFETNEEMFLAAAELLGTTADDMICIQCTHQEDRFYFYATQAEADADTDVSYSVQSSGTPLLRFIFAAGRHEDTGSFETQAEAQHRATYLAESWREHVTATERYDKSNTWVSEYVPAVHP